MIERLRYIRLGLPDPDGMADFATRILGLQAAGGAEGERLFRSDFRGHTLAVHASQTPEEILGAEVRSPEALADLAGRLDAAGHAPQQGTAAEVAARQCKAMIWIRPRGGLRLEFVVRPQDSGWRYFGARDAGITEFFGAALASTDPAADIGLWTNVLGARVSDWLGDAAYLAIDDEHHRIAIHPSARDGLLEVQYRLEGLHEVMQNSYFLQSAQVAIAHGPGRRAASDQVFLSFRGPVSNLFGYVAEGTRHPFTAERLPRQFPRNANSFCTWGSQSQVPEYAA